MFARYKASPRAYRLSSSSMAASRSASLSRASNVSTADRMAAETSRREAVESAKRGSTETSPAAVLATPSAVARCNRVLRVHRLDPVSFPICSE